MHKHLLSIVIAASALTAGAVAPCPWPVKYTAPDGSLTEVLIKGNEYSQIYYDMSGNALLPDADGVLVPASEQQVQTARAAARTSTAQARSSAGLHEGYLPYTGSPKVCVILVQFSDVKFSVSSPYNYFNSWLNDENFTTDGNTGSVREYFKAQSSGKYSPDFKLYGPVTLSRARSYYASTNSAYKMVHDACGALDSQVDFSEFDLDGDGNVDNVYIIFAGQGSNYGASNAPWPHNSTCETGLFTKKTVDGKLLYHYSCTSEQGYTAGQPDGIGTFIHEFGHVIGFPDFYNTDVAGDDTPYFWSIMDRGNYLGYGKTPCGYNAYERNALGWLDYTELTSKATVRLRPLAEQNFAVTIPTGRQGDYYILENRPATGWDRGIYGGGMLIWHIDASDASALANKPNNDSSHLRVQLVRADNDNSAGSSWADAWTSGSFTESTTPAMVRWCASSGSATEPVSKPVTAITKVNDLITFDYCGGSADNIVDPARVEYTVSVTATAGGTACINGNNSLTSITAEQGSKVTLNASANSGYEFTGWTFGGIHKSDYTSYEITVDEATAGTYTANFRAKAVDTRANYAHFDGTVTSDRVSRGVVTLTLTAASGNSLTVQGPGGNTGRKVYADCTSQQLVVKPGSTITVSGSAASTDWMHSYVYVDYDRNGQFDVDADNTGVHKELVAHTGYNINAKSDGSDTADPTVKSDNSAVNHGDFFAVPAFTIPSTTAAGTYRLRYKVDWNNNDPYGRCALTLSGHQKGNYIDANGGSIIDLTLKVEAATAIDDVAADDNVGDVEYYNLMGVRIATGDLTPGIYIIRRGNQVSKTIVR